MSSMRSICGAPSAAAVEASSRPRVEPPSTSEIQMSQRCTSESTGCTANSVRPVRLSRTSCLSSLMRILELSAAVKIWRSAGGSAYLRRSVLGSSAPSSPSPCASSWAQRRCHARSRSMRWSSISWPWFMANSLASSSCISSPPISSSSSQLMSWSGTSVAWISSASRSTPMLAARVSSTLFTLASSDRDMLVSWMASTTPSSASPSAQTATPARGYPPTSNLTTRRQVRTLLSRS
mmetsp:Transcript_19817/g.62785  ORF Transcript_19817/g.62785 Transcript_19817/m.62785 type:complete len:236 (-) Transcript_19817:152-859(-)